MPPLASLYIYKYVSFFLVSSTHQWGRLINVYKFILYSSFGEWRHLFDELLDGSMALEVPLEGNGKSLCSLRIRISDALKWLADRFRAG